MNYLKKQRLIIEAFKFSDLVALTVGLLIAAGISGHLNEGTGLMDILSVRLSLANFVAVAVFGTAWLFILRYQRLYSSKVTNVSISREFMPVFVSVSVGALLMTFLSMRPLLDISIVTKDFIATFVCTVTACTLVLRKLTAALFLRVHLGGKNHGNVVIVGFNKDSKAMASRIKRSTALGFEFSGFIIDDDDSYDNCRDCLGHVDDFVKIFEENHIDELVVTTPVTRFDEPILKMINHAVAHGVLVDLPTDKLFSGLIDVAGSRIRGESRSLDGNKTFDLLIGSGHQFGWEHVAKRVCDHVGASILVLLLSPFILAAAIMIKLDSPGPIFFIQDRYGYNGRIFRLYKFRTMVPDADAMQDELRKDNELDGAAFKIKKDPRITPIGKFLRKSSIDELPQLLNVIKGDMSLVGPRPLPLADYERFDKVTHMRRMSVLPGITCTWQAGGRNDVTFDQWMALDMDYIDTWSFWGDIKILLSTVPAVLFGRGAS